MASLFFFAKKRTTDPEEEILIDNEHISGSPFQQVPQKKFIRARTNSAPASVFTKLTKQISATKKSIIKKTFSFDIKQRDPQVRNIRKNTKEDGSLALSYGLFLKGNKEKIIATYNQIEQCNYVNHEDTLIPPMAVTTQPAPLYLSCRNEQSYLAKRFFKEFNITAQGSTLTNTDAVSEKASLSEYNKSARVSTPVGNTIVELCTCMFCVRAFCYHCVGEEDAQQSWIDNPCECSSPTEVKCGCVLRWSVLSLSTVCLPCLLCYPVLRMLQPATFDNRK